MKTLEMLLREGTEILETAEIGEARLDAWLLLEYITGKNRAYYYAHMDQETEEGQEKAYLKLCRKRAEHIPLQHLTGTACFMGYDFFVDERVLVPRQDTEILVEEALNLLKKTEKPRILDMCTGSGCILLSILKEIPEAEGTGADLSEELFRLQKKMFGSWDWITEPFWYTVICFPGNIFLKPVEKHRESMICLCQILRIFQQGR